MKKFSLFFVLYFLVSTGIIAQVANNPLQTTVTKPTGDPKTTMNYMANLMYYYDQVSQNVRIPEEELSIFKAQAAKNNISEAKAVKVASALKPIFNESLSPRERIEVINFYRAMDGWDAIIPQSFYDKAVKKIQALY